MHGDPAGEWDTVIPGSTPAWREEGWKRQSGPPTTSLPRRRTSSPLLLSYLARVGYATLVAAKEAGARVPDPLRADLAEVLRRAESMTFPGLVGTTAAAQLATARAWARRLDGDPAPDLWREAVAAWEETGYCYAVAASH